MSIKEKLEAIGGDFLRGARKGFAGPYSISSPSVEVENPKGSGKLKVKFKGKIYKRYKRGFGPTEKRDKKWGRLEPGGNYYECGSTNGFYHYLGCDLEDCPICKGQLLSCGHGILFETPGVRCL